VIDYFATSLPTMTLFDDDLKQRNGMVARFLKAQAYFGLGLKKEGLGLLEELLHTDQGYSGAIDLLRSQSR